MMKRYRTTFGIKNVLTSYIEYNTPRAINENLNILRQLKRENNGKVFLDSGAFSVWNSGKTIKLADYISFVNRFGEYFDVIANLDVMNDPDESYNNYLDMIRMVTRKEFISKIVPVYHYPEPSRYLDNYLDKTDYVGIGAITQLCRSTSTLLPYLNKVINYIPLEKKIHLFGISRFDVLFKFNKRITSVDSTSWSASPLYLTVLTNNAKKFIDYKGKTNATKENTIKWLCHDVAQIMELEERVNAYIEKLSEK